MDIKTINTVKIEELIKKSLNLENATEDKNLFQNAKIFINFFKLYDVLENTIHIEVITCIYIDPESANLKSDLQAKKLNIDPKTLFNYRKKYAEIFKRVCFRENSSRKTSESGKSFPKIFKNQ